MVHLEVVGDVARLRPFEGESSGFVRKHGIGLQGRQVGAWPQHHNAKLLVLQILLGGGHGYADFDMRLDDGSLPCRAVDVHQCDVREVAGIVATAGDQGGRRISSARDQNVSRMNPQPLYLCRGRDGRLVATRNEGLHFSRMLEHDLFNSSTTAVQHSV